MPTPVWTAPGHAPEPDAIALVRRGVDHGFVAASHTPVGALAPAAWQAAEAVHLPGVLRGVAAAERRAIRATRATFDRLRGGARFLDEVDARIGDHDAFRYAGSTVDRTDQREIERVFVDVPGEKGTKRVRDLTLRLSWVAHDESDASLRIRCSFGHEATRDWLAPDVRSAWSDHLGASVFPENLAVRRAPVLGEQLGALLDRPYRLSELIVFAFAPGGGARFHHDADPGQRGVVFAQLDGTTIWLACPRRELAAEVAKLAELEPETVFERMQDDADPDLRRLLDATPALTGALARRGRLFVVRAGDVLLVPSHDEARCCWHSVFGVGVEPSLAHSMAIFDALPDGISDPRLAEP